MRDNIQQMAEREASAVVILRDQLAALGQGDEDSLSIAIEGETNFRELVEELLARQAEVSAFRAAIKEQKNQLTSRDKRFERQEETLRALLLSAMDLAGLKKLETALGTVSLSSLAPSAIVSEAADVPARFWKPEPPTLDQKALTAALRARDKALRAAMEIEDAGERAAALAKANEDHPDIPGASLSNGGATVTIRRS